jgi:rare lipoprotein A
VVQIDRLFPGDEIQLASARRAAASEAQALPPPGISALMLEDRVDMDSAAVARAQTPAQSSATTVDQAALQPGFYLQLGAYGRAGKAEEMGEKIRQSGVDLAIEVVRSGSVNRLYSGPYATRALAQEAARTLPAGLGLKPIVVRR